MSTDDPRDDLIERFRAALMRAHADDWDMETVSEAAHICAAVVTDSPQPESFVERLTADQHRRLIRALNEPDLAERLIADLDARDGVVD